MSLEGWVPDVGDYLTLAEVVEPFLLKIGFVVRTPTGRKVTPPAYAHLGTSAPTAPGAQGQLPL